MPVAATLLTIIAIILGVLIYLNWNSISDLLNHWFLYYQD